MYLVDLLTFIAPSLTSMFQHSYIGPRTIAEKHSSIAMHYGYGLGISNIVQQLTNTSHKAVHLFNIVLWF